MAVEEVGLEQDTFAIDEFLAVEAAKDLLRFSTAGSVDDGKSTLIGRLLYDSRNVYEDQVKAVTGKVPGQRKDAIDFALLTDGLRAEREQGITIDVAYRYFSTARRKFIIADTPGHEQYTRNMATGASTADLAIILVDARKGILIQSRRHASIASLLGIRHLVAAVNKMDLVGFSEEVFRKIEGQLKAMIAALGGAELQVIPVSALLGDNVVERSIAMPWYGGPTLLEHLEEVPVSGELAGLPFRMAVQRVIRPDQHYRGFAGQIASGTIRPGDVITAYPSGRTSRVATITTFDGDLAEASAPLSVALTLEDELDISRGDLIAEPARRPRKATQIEASLVWFDAQGLETERPYLVKHGAQTVPGRVTRVLHRKNVQTLEEDAVTSLAMNEIGVVELELTRPIFFDSYKEDRSTGAFILIDPVRNGTLGAGMIRDGLDDSLSLRLRSKGALVRIGGWDPSVLEDALVARGAQVVRTRVVVPKILRDLVALGLVVLADGAVEEGIEADSFASVDGLIHHLQAVGLIGGSVV